MVVGVVPLSSDKAQVLLVHSRRGGYELPNGAWKTEDVSTWDGASSNAWNKAGIKCKFNYDLGIMSEQPTGMDSNTAYHFFEATVEKEEDTWPDMDECDRHWLYYSEAKQALAKRPALLEALERSTMKR
jgi:diphosphoinositol-polyphosphate diphosphatase